MGVQLNALTLINSMISGLSGLAAHLEFTAQLDACGINLLLKVSTLSVHFIQQLQRNVGSTDSEFKHQMYIYQVQLLYILLFIWIVLMHTQHHRFKELKMQRDQSYNKENPEHEELLLRLWKATFPNTTLENRVCEQWKLIGFQGTDPATDFRGMGILGLNNLLYFAEVHPETFRKIVTVQAERKERDYPVAVAGINITQMLYDLLRIGQEGTC